MKEPKTAAMRGSAPTRPWFTKFADGPGPVMILTAALVLPYLDKAYHVDDTLFVKVAQQVRKHPLHPFRMEYNWAGEPESFWYVTANPPMGGYLIAAVSLFTGFREWSTHLAFAVMAVACSWLMFQLACRMCSHPTLVVACVVVTPTFLVSACNVMADIPLLFFWLAAVWFAMRFVEDGRTGSIWLCGVAASAAVMTKYFGAALVPLLAVYCLSTASGRRRHTVALLLPVAVLAAWGMYSMREFGYFHPLYAAKYSVEYKGMLGSGVLRPAFYTVTFLGGGIVWPIALLPTLIFQSRSRWSAVGQVLVLALAVGVMTAYEYRFPVELRRENRAPEWVFVAMLLAGGMAIVAVLQGWAAKFDRTGTLLGLWFVGTIAFCVFFNWTVNERIILPAVFPVAVLAMRWFESLKTSRVAVAWTAACLIPTMGIALLVAAADYDFAAAGRSFAQTTVRRLLKEGSRIYFAGHWGFQYYMEQEGALALNHKKALVRPGDLVVYPTFHTTQTAAPVGWSRIELDTEDRFADTYGVQTMNTNSGAGFYSTVFGNVPYAPTNNRSLDFFFILAFDGTPQWRR
jgi:4-amino-4-deoxy-L-arabinose transferase-like glycosyltransferase